MELTYARHLFVVSFVSWIIGTAAKQPLNERLRTWETISSNDVTIHRERRSFDRKVTTVDREVSFKAFQRHFTLSLMSSPVIFAPNFSATVYSRAGQQKVRLDKTSVYSGTVLGEPGSSVRAHLQGRELMASIKTKDDTYIVEPAWRHMPSGKETGSDLIVYRRSDLNLTRLGNPHKNNSYCGIDDVMKEIRQHEHDKEKVVNDYSDVHHRSKRSNGKKLKICTLSLVADYRFHDNMGNGKYLQTMYYLINLIERVNHIFKTTNWGSEEGTDEYQGYGFQINDIKVYKESTPEPSFNSRGQWTAKELLEEFSKINHGQCLAHLFTYVDFDKGVLGLAYVGASRPDAVGGICSKPYKQGNLKPTLYLNTGLTTAKNWGQKILTLEADLVTTHELGHNFGAEHDNGEDKNCSPGESNDGNYIMYPAAVSGENENNDKFSICSKRNVLPCLKRKALSCFQEDREVFCGNYKVEEGEECDAGYFVTKDVEDACCTTDCKLKKGAKCSKNALCCNEKCQAASNTTLCYSEIPDSCWSDTYCDGVNFTCPPHVHKADDSPCGDAGKCKNGKCQPFCTVVGMKPCLCTGKSENLCLRCCAPKGTVGEEMIAKCKPYMSGNMTEPLRLRNNAKCALGYCEKGKCIKQTQDVIERVWTIFEHIAPDKIGEFLADNIVGAVLVFSLLFWVPCGCLVNFVDKKREKQRRKDEQWFTEKGSDFYRYNAYGGMFGSSNTLHKVQKGNVGAAMATRAGLNAKDQWHASKERGLVTRKSQEKLGEGANGQASAAPQDERYRRGEGMVVKDSEINASNNAQASVNNDAGSGDGAFVRRTSRPQLTRQQRTTEEAPV